jgi:hypothetical protein
LRMGLIDRLGKAGIRWAGWGYCAGRNAKTDIKLISDLKKDLGIEAFIIDAEPGNPVWRNPKFPKDPSKNLPDLWTLEEFDTFTKAVNDLFGTSNLALSTWPVLKVQDDEKKGNPVIKLMQIAAPRVAVFAPQAYWMSFPNKVHYNLGYKKSDYPPNDPVSFVRLVIQSWRDLKLTNPLVISGQAYWGEGGPSLATMNKKAKQFCDNFADWDKLVGFNWYHAGGKNNATSGSLSDNMVTSIAAAKLGGKPYQSP